MSHITVSRTGPFVHTVGSEVSRPMSRGIELGVAALPHLFTVMRIADQE